MLQVLFGGGLGGILPTISKLAATYVGAPKTPWPEYGLLFGLALFAVIGAAIAYATVSSGFHQALVAGIAAPGIITNLVAGADASKVATGPMAQDKAAFEFISSAHAQTSLPNVTLPPNLKAITIAPRVQGGLPEKPNIPITAAVPGFGDAVNQVPVGTINSLSSNTTITVPSNAEQITIGDATVPVPPDNKIDLEVATKPTGGSDFFWALGGKRSYSVQSVVPKVDFRALRP